MTINVSYTHDTTIRTRGLADDIVIRVEYFALESVWQKGKFALNCLN